MNVDAHIRGALLASVRPADPDAGYQAVQARLDSGRRRLRARWGRAVWAAVAIMAVVVVVGAVLGGPKVYERLRPDRLLIITDVPTQEDGAVSSTLAAALDGVPAEPDASIYRGSPERTGVYPAGGPTASPRLLWKFDTGGWVRSSPVVSEGTVYVASDDWHLYAIDAKTGREKWRFRTRALMWASPAVADGVVYCGQDALYAVDADSGREIWRVRPAGNVYSSPVVWDGVVYVANCALDAKTGKKIWSIQTDSSVFSSPVVWNGMVYFESIGRFDNGPRKDASVYCVDAKSGRVIWRVDSPLDSPRSPLLISGGLLYAGASVMDPQTGQEISRFDSGDITAVGDGTAYWSDEADRRGHLYAMDLRSGAVTWVLEGGGGEPALSGGMVYVGGVWDGRLHAVDARTGQEKWAFQTSFGVRPSPAISDGVVYFGSDDHYLYAVK